MIESLIQRQAEQRPGDRAGRVRGPMQPEYRPPVAGRYPVHEQRVTTPSAGWLNGTAMITSTSWRCWPARTAAPARAMTGTGCAMRAWPPSGGTGCGPPTAPADCTAARRPSRAETEKTARRGLHEAPRVTLRRHVTTAAASAGSEQEFFALLDRAGVLARKRYSARNPGQVTGYAVALPGDIGKDGGPVWYGGGKLAADLTWPRLRQRWTSSGPVPG